jgi:two-component system response regulator YesN
MPEMDGIELIRTIREDNQKIRIIILSGYSDFAYLKEAIKLGVDSYLLKPLDNDELTLNIYEAVKNIEKARFEDIRQHHGIELLKSNTMNRLVSNSIGIKEFEEKTAVLEIDLTAKQYLCATCLVNFTAGNNDDDDDETLMGVKAACDEILKKSGVTFIDILGQIVILFLGDGESSLREAAEAALEEIVAYVTGKLSAAILIGVGMPAGKLTDIWKSYDSALRCLDYSIFMEDNRIFWHDKITQFDAKNTDAISVDYDKLRHLLRTGEKEEFFSYIEKVLAELLSSKTISINYIRNYLMRLALEVISAFQPSEKNSGSLPVMHYDYAALYKIRTLQGYEEWFFHLCEKLFAETSNLQRKSHNVVNLVVSYIEEHYNESLTLNEVAAIFYMNTSYLGQIFKKEIGESFTNYINGYRIEKAM